MTSRSPTEVHIPVLSREVAGVFEALKPRLFIDGTVGAGGHARILLQECIPENGSYVAFDRDGEILELARNNLAEFGDRVVFIHANFSEMKKEMESLHFRQAEGILLDLGVSSLQMDSGERGFAFKNDALLDMRMDVRSELTAYDVVNGYGEAELLQVMRDYSDLKNPGFYVRRILNAREKKPIRTTGEFRSLFQSSGKFQRRHSFKIDPSTEVFQAIRIEVNDELNSLKKGLDSGFRLLKPKGIMAVISFHSLEDRIVKNFFREKSLSCRCPVELPCICGGKAQGELVFKKPVTASEMEIKANPRSRSAKLRALCKAPQR